MSAWAYTYVASAASLLLMLAAVSCEEAAAPVVRTQHGSVRGRHQATRTDRQFLAFYNIPFARPPVGPLRFKDPQPPEKWTHIRDATLPGPMCTQNPSMLFEDVLGGTEDCLYLNVFTPELKPTKLYPVMVWIHGGGFVCGGATWVEPDPLLDEDVIVVTTNYRLGILGFLSTGDEAAPGNYGLKDQSAALKWVKQNIAAFGGDPGSVTIFGESAGSASVHYQLLSPASRGLFERAISQSGVALNPWSVPWDTPADRARKLADIMGCPQEPSAALVHCLQGVDDYQLTAAQMQFMEWFIFPDIPFRAVVDDKSQHPFLPKHPLQLAPPANVPWIVGLTRDEGCMFTSVYAANTTLMQELEQDSERLFPLSLSYDTSSQADVITEKIYDYYFPSGGLPMDKLTQLYSDAHFNWNTDEAVRIHRDTSPVYYYLFSYEGENRFANFLGELQEDLGVCHADDLFYLFSNNSYMPLTNELSEEDQEMSRTLTKLWTNFAKTGNPTPNNEPLGWPRVSSGDELEYMDIGEKLEVKKGLYHERINFWRSLPLREKQLRSAVKEEL